MSGEPTSIEHGSFDTTALQIELTQALEDDRKYKLTDNMKKRAIHTASSYDEFKNLVACADLKPVSQKELQNFSKSERSNNLSYKKRSSTRNPAGSHLRLEPTVEASNTQPANSVQFCRHWQRYLKSTESKFSYLRITTPQHLGVIFKADIDTDLFVDIICVLRASWQLPEDTKFVLETLEALTQTSRLSLLFAFMENNDMNNLHELVHSLERALQTVLDDGIYDRLSKLRTQLKIEPEVDTGN